MKTKILLILLVTFFTFISGCGKKTTKKSALPNKVTKKVVDQPKPKEEVLSPDEFSEAFTKPSYRNKNAPGEKSPEIEKLPYKINSLEKSAFANDEYKDNEPPVGTLAAKLQSNDKYFWLPKWHFVGKGEVYLPGAAISEDRSILAILETVPRGDERNKGTMIILINTYNWTISRIHYFKENLFSKVFFVHKRMELIVLEEPQLDIKYNKIHKINIRSGKIVSSSLDIPDSVTGITVSPKGGEVFLSTANQTPNYYIFSVKNLNKKPKKRKCSIDKAFLAVYQNRIAVMGEKKITTYKISFPQKMLEIPNPNGAIPDNAVFIGSEDKIAYSTYLKPLTVSVGEKSKTLSNSAGRVIFYREDLNILAFEEFMNRQITFVRLSDFSVITNLIPNRIKPKTQSGALLLSYLPHHDRYLVLDTQGHLCLYNKPGKKWRKQIIFEAQKK